MCALFASVLDGLEIPFLASLSLMKKLNVILDLANQKAYVGLLGCTVDLHMIQGHLCIKLSEYPADVKFEWHEQDWHDCEFLCNSQLLNKLTTTAHAAQDSPSVPQSDSEPQRDACNSSRRRMVKRLRQLAARAVVTVYKAMMLGMTETVSKLLEECKSSAKTKKKAKAKAAKALPAVPPTGCSHSRMKRRENASGRFATCENCLARWKWDENGLGWRFHPSSKSFALPSPSAQTVVDHSWPTSTASASTSLPGAKAKRARPTSSGEVSGYRGAEAELTQHYNLAESFGPLNKPYARANMKKGRIKRVVHQCDKSIALLTRELDVYAVRTGDLSNCFKEPKPAAIVIHSAQRQDRKVREAIFTRCERQVSNGGIFIVEYNLAHHHDEPGILPSLVDLPDTCEASFTNTICDNVIELSFITNSRCFLKAAAGSEGLSEIRQPKPRFETPVRVAIFFYGLAEDDPVEKNASKSDQTDAHVPGLKTDISFSGIPSSISKEVRAAVARLHVSAGHPHRQELVRLLAAHSSINAAVFTALEHVRCGTCERAKMPLKPRPASVPEFVGQFGEQLQADVFYIRDLSATNHALVAVTCLATKFYQAAISASHDPQVVLNEFDRRWLRHFGYPLFMAVDADGALEGVFIKHLQESNVMVTVSPADAHHQIGAIERRNAIFRSVVERLLDENGVCNQDQLDLCFSAEFMQ
ncbi:TY5A [Symbiodinium pilosum]|uniref:TY5A protein n=1 Tax=Symbiodinium pilosum TaxID=2952 RepID=A0A812QKZ8_SYMPI|nr:TY5A [Symbiodinium pilosum]